MEHFRWPWLALVVALALLAGAVGGGLAGGIAGIYISGGRGASTSQPIPTGPATNLVLNEDSATVDVAKKVIPAVVTIVSVAQEDTRWGKVEQETAAGSGVIIDKKGYIVTNDHVVRDAEKLVVELSNGEKKEARVLGTDYPYLDVAVVKIDGNDLPVAELGDSDRLVVGQRVMAVGNPLARFKHTVSQGIIGGLHRGWASEGAVMEDLIQSDAAINFGGSGGALVNMAGQVVGINTTVVRTTKSGEIVEGMGFSLPINIVRTLAQEIIQHGKTARPYFGIAHQTLTPALAASTDLPVPYGVYVVEVSADSPAGRAGLKKGDIISQIGRFPVDEDHPFLSILMKFKPQDKVSVAFRRGNRTMQAELVLMERP
ncbi:MAG: trypsin-like peptidase domain-containing protein [Chloroflexi bacterium]|nr:trypsin-like peptidase domain-containing protein [Chloroflexota bacterium]